MAKAAFTINLAEEKQGFFCRVPLRMGQRGRKQSPTTRLIAGKIYGVSSKKGSTSCRTSYAQLQEEFGVCRSTVATSLGTLKENKLIEEKKRNHDGTDYTYVGVNCCQCNEVPMYLFTAKFFISGEERRLTKAQALVLGFLMSETYRLGNKGKYEGSIAQIARELSLSETTVKKALSILMKARLIYRPAEDKGQNGHKLTKYSVAKELFFYKEKRRPRVVKAEPKEEKKLTLDKHIEDLNAVSERTRYYDLAKSRTVNKARDYIDWAKKTYQSFDMITKQIGLLNIEIAKAEVKNLPTLSTLQARHRGAEIQRREIMRRYKISEERMQPEYYAICKKCFDTGALPGGAACSCYICRKE